MANAKRCDRLVYADDKTAEEVRDIIDNINKKDCSTCKYGYRREGYGPCFSCKHYDKWEAKGNG